MRICFNQNKSRACSWWQPGTLIASLATLPEELDLGQDHMREGRHCPRVAPVIAHLQAVISRVICPDSVCLWTSPQSTGHWEEMPGGYGYENIHHQLPNIIIVTVTLRIWKPTSSSAQIKLIKIQNFVILLENTHWIYINLAVDFTPLMV